jgi:hypothetical protein
MSAVRAVMIVATGAAIAVVTEATVAVVTTARAVKKMLMPRQLRPEDLNNGYGRCRRWTPSVFPPQEILPFLWPECARD